MGRPRFVAGRGSGASTAGAVHGRVAGDRKASLPPGGGERVFRRGTGLNRWQVRVVVAAVSVAVVGLSAWLIWLTVAVGPQRFKVANVTLEDLSGRSVDLASFRGEPLVLYITSLDCSACRNDWSLLAARQRAAGGRFRIVAVVSGSSADAARGALAGTSVQVPVLVDPSDRLTYDFDLDGLPSYAFLDARGRLAALIWLPRPQGEITAADWSRYVAEMLKPS
jgi:peroxiredoxin